MIMLRPAFHTPLRDLGIKEYHVYPSCMEMSGKWMNYVGKSRNNRKLQKKKWIRKEPGARFVATWLFGNVY